ncbi:MAG: M3 family metallopeptidase [Candidatus Krumholzibacteria bacterium]
MRRWAITILLFAALAATSAVAADNPFFSKWGTPFEVPDFTRIKTEHYMPAFEAAMEQQRAEIDDIIDNPDPPSFENTIEVLEYSGELLDNVANVFFNLRSTDTNDAIDEIAKDVAPKLSALNDDINLNPKLFARVKAVYDERKRLELNTEQARLLEETYKGFVRGGANLSDDKKSQLREINERLSVLTLEFGENVLAENNAFELVIDDKKDLAGLPDNVIQTATETAVERDHAGKWVFTLHKASMIPFISYSERRDLREKIYRGYFMRGNNGDERDNKEILQEMASLRAKRAKLLGYKTHAHYVLDDNMAKTPKRVYELLDRLWKPALKRAKAERADMQKMIEEEGHDFKLASWDWWYYAEKVKKAKYDFDDEVLRPYFEVENVRKGVFELATRLFGITFHERFDIPKYHDEVRTFEVKDADGSLLAIYLIDYHPRASKRGGAWMSTFRSQHKVKGEKVIPIVINVANVSKPTADGPALLSLDEVTTLFHEFGHALHGMLSDCTYESLSGTSVARDFVEMPSQVIENWATEPEVLKFYARHHETGETIPDELMAKMKNAKLFNQGFATTEYLAASYLDMDWHTLTDAKPRDVLSFEKKCLDRLGLIPEIISRYRSGYFRHIFAGGYSSGYYSYVWAEVVDADAFQAFKENGLFDKETATKFRKYILARGGTEEPMELYKKFRGREPKIEPLLERRGLN